MSRRARAAQCWRDERGFTFAELLVVVAVMAGILAGVVAAQQAGMQAYALGSTRVEVQQNDRIALERISRDIREAFAITATSATGFTLQYDRNQDGVADAAPTVVNECPPGLCNATRGQAVTYSWAGAGSPLQRLEAGVDVAGAQTLIATVQSIAFTYPAASTVAITIRTATERAVAAGSAGASQAEMTTTVSLRNSP